MIKCVVKESVQNQTLYSRNETAATDWLTVVVGEVLFVFIDGCDCLNPQEISQQIVPVLGKKAFGMKLYAIDRISFML